MRFKALLVATILMGSPEIVIAQDIEIWFKTFIPKDAGRPIPNSEDTMVSWKFGESFLGCFSTDNRTFSSNEDASSRTSVRLTLPADGKSHQFSGACGITKEMSCSTGELLETDSCVFSDVFDGHTRRLNEYVRYFDFDLAAPNPIPPISPDIDAEFTITEVRPGTSGAFIYTVKGHVDEFPAFEAYIRYKGQIKTLFRVAPKPGASPINLVGGATVPINETVVFPR